MGVGSSRAIGLVALPIAILLLFTLPAFAHGDGSTGAAPLIPASSASVYYPSLWDVGFLMTTAAALCGAALFLYIFRRRVHSKGPMAKILPLLVLGLLGLSSVPMVILTGAATTATPPAIKSVTYQSDFAHGYTTGWFIQPGTSLSGTI